MTAPDRPAADLFIDAWAIYRLVIENDYLWHSRVEAALAELMAGRFPGGHPVRFLDLACGDADTTAKALAGRPVGRYVGADRSPDALAAAARAVAGLGCPADFIPGDYLEFLESTRDEFDVVYVGLSAHHLGDRLGRLFAAARARLAPGGVLAAYEPFVLPDETRAESIDRLCAIADRLWVALTPARRAEVAAHVRGNDLPVTLAEWDGLAAAAGFGPARRLFKSPDRLYELVAHDGGDAPTEP